MELRSAYQRKNYEVKEYFLDETDCPKCGRPFMVDIGECKDVEIDGEYDFHRIICPYCKKIFFVHD